MLSNLLKQWRCCSSWMGTHLVDDSATKLLNIKTFCWGAFYTKNRNIKLHQLYTPIHNCHWITLMTVPWRRKRDDKYPSLITQNIIHYLKEQVVYFKLRAKKNKNHPHIKIKSKSREFSINLLICQNMLKNLRWVWDKHFNTWWWYAEYSLW